MRGGKGVRCVGCVSGLLLELMVIGGLGGAEGVCGSGVSVWWLVTH